VNGKHASGHTEAEFRELARHTQTVGEAAEQLRGLIREAHGAAKDLRGLLREYRELKAQIVQETQKAANDELARLNRHLQQQMNEKARELNASVRVAQQHILKRLTLARLEPDPNHKDQLRFYFEGSPFDENYPLPDAPEDKS
jgi:ABC-type transporter Mla subunit MlaD